MCYVPPYLRRGVGGNRAEWGRSAGTYYATTQFYFYPVMSKVQNSINIYPWFLTSLNVSNSRFHKFVMFWMWRHHSITLWRHSRWSVGFDTMLCSKRQLAMSTAELTLLITWLVCIVASEWYGKFRKAYHGLAVGRIMVLPCRITG